MSWNVPVTPPNTPYFLRSSARLLGAGVLAQQAANVVTAIPARLGLMGRSTVYQTKTKMPYVKKSTQAKSKVSKAVTKYVKKAITRNLEVKGRSFGVSATLVHTLIYTANITANVVEGVFDYQRIGDSIKPKELRLNYSFIAPTTSGAYGYRILVFWSGAETASTALTNAGFSQNQVFQPTIATDTQFAAVPNPKAVTVLADRIVNINSNITAVSDMVTGSINIRMPAAKFNYASNSSIYGRTKNLYLCVLPYVAGGTAGTTACGIAFVNYDFRYADS